MTSGIDSSPEIISQDVSSSSERQMSQAEISDSRIPASSAVCLPNFTALHSLVLLADSALPLGSFAFSSGLESYLAHRTNKSSSGSNGAAFHSFLRLSLSTLASTALPYVFTAYRRPSRLEDLDNDIDASTPCTVARRASIAQGRALLSVWERSFKPHYGEAKDEALRPAIDALKAFQYKLRNAVEDIPGLGINAHLAPIWGVVTRAMGLSLQDSAYMFLFSHARTVISAGVRASVLGPYQAQHVLAMPELQEIIRTLLEATWNTEVEDAGQTIPAMDLWIGRHEKLYSRIFNS
ncbi:hypothetical protein EJ05DRAFT_512642 [Pseudovirgaria hyperparasitica]|uniref:Urease accessory protein UreF n=1 Tax=Pseudovirgaria hyperparasitica TaxID=470096 RepID=A0A6A6W4V4_9PEZI|nr:uncharacterized protein EJ05DRAFT_512642 [Pseudovirgaria hyperparasitica]KAF2756081.1 hypothetical protein EJ05DRAFT_512642 [Pseudovirgaria hyperparasitica]